MCLKVYIIVHTGGFCFVPGRFLVGSGRFLMGSGRFCWVLVLVYAIQTRNRRKTLKNYLECNTGELTTLEIEIENENENNTEHQTLEFILNNSRAIKKKRLNTNREKFKGIMKAGGNLVLKFSTATFEMVRTGIKNIMDSLKQNSTMTVDHKQKADKENNIIDELYRVNRRVKGYGFTVNLFRTTSKMMVMEQV